MTRSLLLWWSLSLCVSWSARAQEPKKIRLAAPGFSASKVEPSMADFVSEHFAQKLSLEGISVLSSSEVKALVGLERQRQLMGCDESNCMAELADALGADGVITGSIGKFGQVFQVNIKILSSNNAGTLSIISRKAYSEEELLTLLDEAAEIAALDLKEKLQRPGEDRTSVATSPERAPPASERAAEPELEDDEPELTHVARSPSAPARRLNAVTLWTAGIGVSVYAIEYERALIDHLSVYVQPALLAAVEGLEATLGGRLYFMGTAPEGLFAGVELKASSTSIDPGNVSLGGALGYSLRVAEFIHLSGGVHAGYYLVGENPLFAIGRVDIGLRTHVGLAF